MKLKTKLISTYLAVSVIPLMLIGVIAWTVASGGLDTVTEKGATALETAAYEQLKSIREIKAKQIEQYFKTLEGQLHMVKDNPWTLETLTAFDTAFMENDDSIDSDDWRALEKEFDPVFKDLCADLGWHDIFLMCPEFSIVYTMQKQGDLGTFVNKEPLMSSTFGKAYKKLLADPELELAMSDFAPYVFADNQAAAFMLARIRDDQGEIAAHVGLQVSAENLSRIMATGSNKEKTLEAYLVGSDGHMRSDSILNPEGYSIAASFANDNKIDTEATRDALDGGTDTKVIKNYLGSDVLSAYAPLDVFGNKWALVCEIDEAVALVTKTEMTETSANANSHLMMWIGGGLVVVCLAVALLAWVIAQSIGKPIVVMADTLKDISEGEGDLTARLEVKSNDEIGRMARYFNQFVEKLQGVMRQIAGNASTVAGSATELSATATQMSSGADEMSNQSSSVASAAEEMSVNMNNMSTSTEQMSANINTISSSVEEMTASVGEIAKNAEQAAGVADQASSLTETSNEKIGQLGAAADEIGKVIEVIQDIAEQTNLLALNATIEAARAGDAGKGFAVVATEVKELAKQTADATEDISKRIEAIQNSTGESVESIGKISEVIKNVNEVSRTIASAVEEQSITTKEIAQNVAQVASASETVSKGVTESAAASGEITQNIAGVDSAAKQTAQGAGQTQTAGTELSKLSEELQTLVGQFKV